MFLDNPFQSNRSRNWFSLDWFLYNFKVEHSFNKESNLSFNFLVSMLKETQQDLDLIVKVKSIHFKKEILLKEILKLWCRNKMVKSYYLGKKSQSF